MYLTVHLDYYFRDVSQFSPSSYTQTILEYNDSCNEELKKYVFT